MDFSEEQKLECEALESIYGDDFTKINDKALEVKLCPNPGEGPEQNHVGLTLRVTYSDKYPETAPTCSLQPTKGLPKRLIPELDELVFTAVENGIGEPVVFSVATALQEWMQDHNTPEQTAHEAMLQRQANPSAGTRGAEEEEEGLNRGKLEAEERERRNRYVSPLGIEPGTLVTPESFEDWRKKFQLEIDAKNEERKKKDYDPNKKTGKQIFLANAELGLGLEGEKKEGEGEGDVYWFNEELYDELDEDLLDTELGEDGEAQPEVVEKPLTKDIPNSNDKAVTKDNAASNENLVAKKDSGTTAVVPQKEKSKEKQPDKEKQKDKQKEKGKGGEGKKGKKEDAGKKKEGGKNQGKKKLNK
eukprot:gb/GEZN01008411.1/.p1 GENE.gb/GEZN01008411.1/~~gb/GEZN01008411.1/.p1  ORF type:complete len:360 (+),score=102.25 gb/GEZN01008411.1/:308-1387(+)